MSKTSARIHAILPRKGNKAFFCITALMTLFVFVGCVSAEYSLDLQDQPGEILQMLTINKNGNFVSEVDDPPEIITPEKIESKIQYLAEQYKITPGGWGPLKLYIDVEQIPNNLHSTLYKWNNLCIQYKVPYILVIWRQNSDNSLPWTEVKSRTITVKKHCVKEITILPEKLQLCSPYGNNLHYDEFFRSAPELLLEIKKDRYMDKYSYRVILTNSNASIQWKILHELAKFMNNHHLNYQVLWRITK